MLVNKNKISLRKKILLTADLFIIAGLYFADYFAERFVIDNLKGKGSYIIIENVLQLTYKENAGGLFGFLNNQQLFIMFICLILFFPLFIILIKLPDGKKYTIANFMLSFILAGSAGNFIDRAKYQHAVDYIYFINVDFPVPHLPVTRIVI